MPTIETYAASVPDWSTQIEFVVHEPAKESHRLGTFHLDSAPQPLFLIAVLSTPNSRVPPFLDASILLTDPYQNPLQSSSNNSDLYITTDSRLIIINNPTFGDWDVSARGGVIPYSVTVMAFHPRKGPQSPPSPGETGSSPFKCRACKITAKGLALAIFAAATLPALPAALIIAVSNYLGESVVIAAAFISSVIGDSVDVIAEKLCKKVGLC